MINIYHISYAFIAPIKEMKSRIETFAEQYCTQFLYNGHTPILIRILSLCLVMQQLNNQQSQ
jgi:hypothetical protein